MIDRYRAIEIINSAQTPEEKRELLSMFVEYYGLEGNDLFDFVTSCDVPIIAKAW